MIDFLKSIAWLMARVIARFGLSTSAAQIVAAVVVFTIAFVALMSLIFGIISGVNSCRSNRSAEKLEKVIQENDNRKTKELEKTLSNVDERMKNAANETNAAKSQDLSNRNTQQLADEIERKSRGF